MSALDILLASFILVMAGLSWGVKFLTQRKHRLHLKEFTPLAEGKGWRLEEGNQHEPSIDIRGTTPSGIGWRMILAGRDRKGNHLTHWISPEIALENGVVVIGHLPFDAVPDKTEENLTLEDIREEMLWQRANARFEDQIPEELELFAAGSLEFQQQFAVLSLNKEDIPLILNPQIEQSLLEWNRDRQAGEPPLILFNASGLRLATGTIDDFGMVERVVALGTLMVESEF